ncbi:MAG TPA: molybdopterin-synthase adenylyltransferase MoeB [Candidatus Thermoplasmatota archaeon]|nr:molybdopterin-synthase adenylyltransferase MoeB [Candidatus Thermoplasmatota archaeon]
MTLDRDALTRYARHLILPEVGVKGQEKLADSSVLLVGAGGLGSPAALYLAAAGVGRIGLVDDDVVDRSNLHRQVLFGEKDVGRPKLKAARERLLDLNPRVEVDAHQTLFTSANADDLLRDYDVLVDGTDNFPTRYLANDVAVLQGKPNVHASIFRFEGQASVFDATRGPCYRCLYRKPPPPGLVPSCAEGGVLGVLPGILGTIQAAETIKVLLGVGEPLIGRLLLFDALRMESTTLQLRKDPECPLCGADPTITGLVDYEAFCGLPAREGAVARREDDATPRELADLLASRAPPFVLDVREPWEAQIASIPGSVLVPLRDLAARAEEVPRDREVIVVCRSGARSAQAVALLRGLGHARARNLAGGILAWADDVEPALARY